MAYTFEQVFAADPANPSNIAQNASITIFAPGDGTMTPIAITDPDGQPLANPIPVNANGFGSAFMADIDRVAWAGGGFTGFFTSYEGMKAEATAARTAAEAAASTAGTEAAAVADAAVASVIADADAAASSAESAAANASAAATSAANSAALVGAPADSAIAAAVNNSASATKTALNATFAPRKGLPEQAGKVLGLRMLDRWVTDAFAAPPAADVPVITFDGAGYGTLVTPKRVGDVANGALDMDGDTHFRYFGFPQGVATPADPTQFVDATLKPGGATQAAYWPFSVEFDTTSDIVQVKSRAGSANPNQGIILVNGRIVQDTRILSTTAAGSWTRMRLTFPSTGYRRIQIIGLNPSVGSFGGVQVTTGHSVIRPDYAVKRRIAIIGDSLTNGAGVAPTGATFTETYALRLAYLLGADQVILAGIGGTGWVAQSGGETQSHFGARVAPVVAMNPDVIIFMGSRNDPSATGVQAAVEAALDGCAAVPEVYVTGTVTKTGFTAQNAAIKAGAEAKGRKFVDLAGIIYGTGKAGALTNDGNADFFIGTDGIHPTHEGHKYITRRFFEAIAGAYGQS